MSEREREQFEQLQRDVERVRQENEHLRQESDERHHENEQLRRENERLQEQREKLQQENDQQREKIEHLQKLLAAKTRAEKRQAGPFGRRKHKKDPKPPGRRKGHEPTHRPPPEHVDRTLEAPVSTTCPCCGEPLSERQQHEQFEVDLPPVQPVVTRFVIESAYCAKCDRRFQGRHPEQTSDALGSANIHLGPRALAMAAEMKHRLGIPYAKICDIFENYLDINVVPATLCRAEQRLAAKAAPTYDLLTEALRQCGVVHADETGWRINRLGAWLWVFSSDSVTIYAIGSRGGDIPQAVLGGTFDGILVVDGYAAYDALTCRKGRCVGHLLRRATELAEVSSPNDARYLRRLIEIFQDAIRLDTRRAELADADWTAASAAIEKRLDQWLAFFGYDPSKEMLRLVRHLRKYRGEWLTFLHYPEAPPTNNHAERMIRPAVVIRKTGGCNKTPTGSRVHQVLTSVIVTCHQQGKRFVDFVRRLARGPTGPVDLATLPTA